VFYRDRLLVGFVEHQAAKEAFETKSGEDYQGWTVNLNSGQ